MKTIIIILSIVSAYWYNIGFKEKNYPIVPVQIQLDTIKYKPVEVYAGRRDTAPKTKYNKIGLPRKRQWLTQDEWKGKHLKGEQLKLFKIWKEEHIKSFIEFMAMAVQEERLQYPALLPSIVIAQSILESNFNKSRLSVEGHNLFAHKTQSDKDFLIVHDDDPDDKFTIYKSKWYSLRSHSKLLYKKYLSRIEGNPTIDKWINALCSGATNKQSKKAVENGAYVYATSCMNSCYQCKLKSIIKTYKLEQYD
jgi:flagellum-specific peptidoglycan hydrolase FlgJ